MRQVVVIHGGESFNTHDEYAFWLENCEVSLETPERKSWKRTLQEDLGDRHQVIRPDMPSPLNAKYAEWKIWFDKYVPLLNNDAIFVGHSLGGIFLTKYFSENLFPKSVRGIYLVAAPFNTENNHPLADFIISNDLSKLWQQCGNVTLYHSADDVVVPISNLAGYQKALPYARASVFADRGHFNQETFPELVADIKALG